MGGRLALAVTLVCFGLGCGARPRAATPPPKVPTGAAPALSASIEEVWTQGEGAPLKVTLRGSASRNGQEINVTCRWEYGDGASETGRCEPTHLFQSAGHYTVTLHVWDDRKEEATATLALEVTPPSAQGVDVVLQLVGGAASGLPPLPVFFDANLSRSIGNGQGPAHCEWDFGDGLTATTGDDCSAQHLYRVPGDFVLRVRVTTRDGAVGEASAAVHALTQSGEVQFANISPGAVGAAITSAPGGDVYVAMNDPDGATVTAYGLDHQPKWTVHEPGLSIDSLDASPIHLDALGTTSGAKPKALRYLLDGTGRTELPIAPEVNWLSGEVASVVDDHALLRWTPGGASLVFTGHDGTTWSRGPESSWPVEFQAFAFTTARELMTCAKVDAPFVADGHPLEAGVDFIAFAATGAIEWVHPLGVGGWCDGLGTSAQGTVVAVVDQLNQPLAFGDRTVDAQAALLALDHGGTARWIRPLDAASFYTLAVDPAGVATVAELTAPEACADGNGLTALEYNLAGDFLWKRSFAANECPSGYVAPYGLTRAGGHAWVAGVESGTVPLSADPSHQLGTPPGASAGFWLDLGI